jgi:hypothetical protein
MAGTAIARNAFMYRSFHLLMLLAALLAVTSGFLWVRAYSPLTCYDSLPRVSSWPPAICDLRFDLTFIFIKDSPANIGAVLGVPAALVTLLLALTWRLILGSRVAAATAFSVSASLALWAFLIWWLDRSPYLCAFGFGGFGCSGLIENVGLNVVFLGWLLPLAALIGAPVVGRLARKNRDA